MTSDTTWSDLIQTFLPEFVIYKRKYMTTYKYIGNDVPPLLSYIIADKVEEVLEMYIRMYLYISRVW